MSLREIEEKISQLIIFQNDKGMIKEQDLRNFCETDDDFKGVIKNILSNFKK